MRACAPLVLLALLAPMEPARAEDGVTSAELKRCLDTSGGVTAAMTECLSNELALQDKRLNEVYQALMRKASEQQASELRKAQRAWLAYRDATCGLFDTFGGGGSLDRVNVGSCEVDIVARRVRFLENLSSTE